MDDRDSSRVLLTLVWLSLLALGVGLVLVRTLEDGAGAIVFVWAGAAGALLFGVLPAVARVARGTRCPSCDERVRAAAKVCRHCGASIG
jgi:hypothetical protein